MVPREKPPFPPEAQELLDTGKKGNDTGLSNATQKLHLNQQAAGQTQTEEEQLQENLRRVGRDEEETEEEDPVNLFIRPKVATPDIDCRQLIVEGNTDGVTVVNSAMGANGRLIVAVGNNGMIWVWKKVDD